MTTPSPANGPDYGDVRHPGDEYLSEWAGRFDATVSSAYGEQTVVVELHAVYDLLRALRDDPITRYEQLIDLCGVDYGDDSSSTGSHPDRFAVVYHLLSVSRNQRLRVVVYLPEESPRVPSVISIWACADWYEREAFDLFGILFDGHPDLRRLLTDYGFIGYPMRKDFPLSGHVEMRFDEAKGRVVYEPVSIDPRVTVPRVIRRESVE